MALVARFPARFTAAAVISKSATQHPVRLPWSLRPPVHFTAAALQHPKWSAIRKLRPVIVVSIPHLHSSSLIVDIRGGQAYDHGHVGMSSHPWLFASRHRGWHQGWTNTRSWPCFGYVEPPLAFHKQAPGMAAGVDGEYFQAWLRPRSCMGLFCLFGLFVVF